MSLLFSLWPHPPISFPAHSVGGVPVPLALAAFNLCRWFGGWLSEGCEVIPHWGLNWHFCKCGPEHFFTRSMAIWMPSLENVRLDLCLYSCWVHCYFFLSWAAWAVCIFGDEFLIFNFGCKHLFSHSEGCLFLSFRVALVVQKLFRWWGAFLKFCLVLIILSIDSKRTRDSCQSVFAYIFLKRVRVIFRPFNSSSYLDFFFCKQLGRDVNSALSPCSRKRLPVRPDWWQLTLPASV